MAASLCAYMFLWRNRHFHAHYLFSGSVLLGLEATAAAVDHRSGQRECSVNAAWVPVPNCGDNREPKKRNKEQAQTAPTQQNPNPNTAANENIYHFPSGKAKETKAISRGRNCETINTRDDRGGNPKQETKTRPNNYFSTTVWNVRFGLLSPWIAWTELWNKRETVANRTEKWRTRWDQLNQVKPNGQIISAQDISDDSRAPISFDHHRVSYSDPLLLKTITNAEHPEINQLNTAIA